MKTELSPLEQTDERVMETVRQLQIAYKLKHTLRYSTTRDIDVHNESVAEHVFALFFLAQYFLPLEDPDRKLNVEKLYQILLFHDFGEITHGDVPYHQKTEAHEQQEREAAKDVFTSLPPFLQEKAYDAWRAYEELEGSEARFAYALDKIEPLFELLDPVNEQSMKRLKFTYRHHIERKMHATEGFPVMRKFVEVVSHDMLTRKIFWEEEAS